MNEEGENKNYQVRKIKSDKVRLFTLDSIGFWSNTSYDKKHRRTIIEKLMYNHRTVQITPILREHGIFVLDKKVNIEDYIGHFDKVDQIKMILQESNSDKLVFRYAKDGVFTMELFNFFKQQDKAYMESYNKTYQNVAKRKLTATSNFLKEFFQPKHDNDNDNDNDNDDNDDSNDKQFMERLCLLTKKIPFIALEKVLSALEKDISNGFSKLSVAEKCHNDSGDNDNDDNDKITMVIDDNSNDVQKDNAIQDQLINAFSSPAIATEPKKLKTKKTKQHNDDSDTKTMVIDDNSNDVQKDNVLKDISNVSRKNLRSTAIHAEKSEESNGKKNKPKKPISNKQNKVIVFLSPEEKKKK